MDRLFTVKRKTKETDIELEINLDGSGEYNIKTGISFFDHMLSSMAKHGLFNLKITAKGDLDIDYHHTVEDVGICLGKAISTALGDRKGIVRFGESTVPMDEAVATVIIDISGRPFLNYNVNLPKEKVGDFDLELVREFFKSLSTSAELTLHINVNYGQNFHHIVEAIFKAFGIALEKATRINSRIKDIPSTKGLL